jgi:hypothetical protein
MNQCILPLNRYRDWLGTSIDSCLASPFKVAMTSKSANSGGLLGKTLENDLNEWDGPML